MRLSHRLMLRQLQPRVRHRQRTFPRNAAHGCLLVPIYCDVMRILITGAGGNIGHGLVDRLIGLTTGGDLTFSLDGG